MRRLLAGISKSMLGGAAIGAIAGAIISGFELRSFLDGAVIGGAIGAFFGLRAQLIRRSASAAGLAMRADQLDI